MQAESKRAGSHLTLQILAGLLIVYLFFPVLLLWPVTHLHPGGGPVPRRLDAAISVVFWPVLKLNEKVPAYHSLIRLECEWLGVE